MYQLGIKWKLWDLQDVFRDDTNSISLRGYHKEPPVLLPADFSFMETNQRLSVEKIASAYCPTRRDLYLEKKLGIRVRKETKTWGQTAGHLIQQFCLGIPEYFADLANAPRGLNYDRVHELSQSYSQTFWNNHQLYIQKLRKRATSPQEEPERLIFLLQQTAKYELTMLIADYTFCDHEGEVFEPLLHRIPINFNEEELRINPGDHLGLSEINTPDFIILNPVVVMGDVKSGNNLKPFHLHTIAGYALGYESQYNIERVLKNKFRIDFW